MRRAIVLLVIAALVVVVGLVFVPRVIRATNPAIATKAVGTWQEVGTAKGYALTIAPDPSQPTYYTIDYGRTFKVPTYGGLEDDHINVWGENASDVVYVATYDEGQDTLTLTSRNGDERYTLQRVGSATPPDWVARLAAVLAHQGGDEQASASWTLTTADKALAAAGDEVGGTGMKPDTKVYLIILNGHFTEYIFSAPVSAPPHRYRWIFELADAESRSPYGGGMRDHAFDTSGLTLNAFVLPLLPTTGATSDARLFAELVKAIRSDSPSLSPKALDAHIRAVTGAPISMIVAPYDPTAESEGAMMKITVATWGVDGALGSDMDEVVHDSGGKPLHITKVAPGVGERFFFCGHPVEVRGRDGYVLIAQPAL